jgi:hypothetical protein
MRIPTPICIASRQHDDTRLHIKDLPDPLPNGDYPRVNVQITNTLILPNDGIVGSPTQESSAVFHTLLIPTFPAHVQLEVKD